MSFSAFFRQTSLGKGVQVSDAQMAVASLLDTFTLDDTATFIDRLFPNNVKRKRFGVYLWGSVGSGKSMIMDAFGRWAREHRRNLDVQRQHFLEFTVNYMNHDMNRVFNRNKQRLLLLDELQINDIANGMLLGRLLNDFANNRNFYLMATSNRPPDDLYPSGPGKESIMRIIEYMNTNMHVWSLNEPKDYRRDLVFGESSTKSNFLHPVNEDTYGLFISRFPFEKMNIRRLEINDYRSVELYRGSVEYECAILDYEKFIKGNVGPLDILAVCKTFRKAIGVVNVKKVETREEARRFIDFIDILYDNRTVLVMQMDCNVEELFTKVDHGEEAFAMHRTLSRLREMEFWPF